MTYKDLNKKQKMQYIWDYYKLPIIGTVLGVFFACSLIYTMFIRVPDTNFCGVAIYGQFLSSLNTDKMTADLNNSLSLPKHTSVELYDFYSNSSDVMIEANLNQKFNTYIYASQFHLLIGNKNDTNNFIAAEYTEPISTYLSSEEIAKLEKQNRLLYAVNPENGKNEPFAISLKNSSILKKYNLFQEETAYVAFVPMADNNDNTLRTLKEFMAQ